MLFSVINSQSLGKKLSMKSQHQRHEEKKKHPAQRNWPWEPVCCRKQKEAISMEIQLIKLNLKKKWPTIQAKIYLIEKTQSGAFIYLFFFVDFVCLFAGINPNHSLEYRTVWLLIIIAKIHHIAYEWRRWQQKQSFSMQLNRYIPKYPSHNWIR